MKKLLITYLLAIIATSVYAENSKTLILKVYPKKKHQEAFKVNREFNCLRTTTPPVIDGRLTDKCWRDASIATDFFITGKKALSSHKTIVRACFDDDNLYLSFNCRQKGKLFAAVTNDEEKGRIWNDDSVEVFFDVNGDGRNFYQLLANSIGKVFDYHHECVNKGVRKLIKKDKSWSFNAKVATSREPDSWNVEMVLPMSSMSVAKVPGGSAWRVNFTRFIRGDKKSSKDGENTNWAGLPVGSNLSPKYFGKMIMGKSNCELKQVSPGNKCLGINNLTFQVINNSEGDQRVNAELSVTPSERPPIKKSFIVKKGTESHFVMPYSIEEEEEEYALNLRLSYASSGKLFAERNFSFETPSPLQVKMKCNDYYWGDKTAKMNLKIGLGSISLKKSQLRMAILDTAGQKIKSGEIFPITNTNVMLLLDIRGLECGRYKIVTELLNNGDDEPIAKETRVLSIIKGPF